MDEGVAEGVALLVDEQEMVLPGGAQPGVEHVGGQLDGGSEQAVADPPPADGRRPDDLLGALVEAIEAGEQQLVEPRRDVALAGDGGELLGEERVAVGALEHGADQPVRRLRAEDAAQLLGDVAGAERGEAEVLDALGTIELGEQAANRVAALETVGAVGRHEQHAGQLRATGEHGEQVAGRAVGPVDVLDDEHDRLLVSATPRSAAGSASAGRAPAPTLITELGEHLVDRGVRGAALGDVEAVPGEHDGARRRRPACPARRPGATYRFPRRHPRARPPMTRQSLLRGRRSGAAAPRSVRRTTDTTSVRPSIISLPGVSAAGVVHRRYPAGESRHDPSGDILTRRRLYSLADQRRQGGALGGRGEGTRIS